MSKRHPASFAVPFESFRFIRAAPSRLKLTGGFSKRLAGCLQVNSAFTDPTKYASTSGPKQAFASDVPMLKSINYESVKAASLMSAVR